MAPSGLDDPEKKIAKLSTEPTTGPARRSSAAVQQGKADGPPRVFRESGDELPNS
ncbi:hypothetical protein AB0I10_20670 [Streptomyces sp. NPDC050636]|uniref:hypothetical protein n=1 Tax=Streptomyces sp. NPDC050636 TaxID=3154510 RepID=UPI00343BBD7F